MASWEDGVAIIQSAKDKIAEDQDHLSSTVEQTEHTRAECEAAANTAEEIANANAAMSQVYDASIATSAKEKIEEARDVVSVAAEKASEALGMLTNANEILEAASNELKSLEG